MESNLLHVPASEAGGREYWIDEANGLVKVRDGNGKLVNMADLEYERREMGSADVHIPSALANYAAGYRLAGGIADIVAPVVPTDKESDKYFTYSKDDAFESASTLVQAEGDRVREISPRLSNDLYTTRPYAIGAFIPQGIIANADKPLNPRFAYINRCMNTMLKAREERVASAFSAANFAGYTAAIGATAKWNGGANSDPLADIQTAIELALQDATQLVLNEKVYHAFIRNPNVSKYGLYKDRNQMTPSELSALLELPPIVVAKMKGKSVTTGTYGYVWPHIVGVLHNPPGVPIDGMSIACAKTFRWRKGNLASDANGLRVRMFFDPTRGQDGGEVVVVACNEATVITGAATSYLYTAAWQ